MNKHFIRLDINNNIVKGFSDAFEQPLESDICINENGQRHFEMSGIVNPTFVNDSGIYIYKYVDNSIVLKTDAEIQAEIDVLNNQPKEPTVDDRITALEDALLMIL